MSDDQLLSVLMIWTLLGYRVNAVMFDAHGIITTTPWLYELIMGDKMPLRAGSVLEIAEQWAKDNPQMLTSQVTVTYKMKPRDE